MLFSLAWMVLFAVMAADANLLINPRPGLDESTEEILLVFFAAADDSTATCGDESDSLNSSRES